MLLEQNVKETYKPKLTNDFGWFNKSFTDLITQSFMDFWEKPYQIKLVSVIDNNFSLFKTEEFFVSKIGLKKNLNVGIRISKSTIKMLFDTLGEPQEEFDITKITEIEAKIINSFNDYVYNSFKNLIKIPDKRYIEEPNTANLIFYIINENEEIGKYIVSVPRDVVDIPANENAEASIDINNFLGTSTEVNIHVGTTRMSLSDLKNLSSEDIVVLDNSNLNVMQLKAGGGEKYFNVSPDPTLIMNLEDNGDNEIMDTSNVSQNMWDNIQVEIGAEFDKIKISLGELKQISEGLVVDIGSVYENKIFLKVENKNIAQGELVIINDRYGVRVDKLIQEEEEQQADVQPNVETQQDAGYAQEPQEAENQQPQEEDFDYSDFEIEDENI